MTVVLVWFGRYESLNALALWLASGIGLRQRFCQFAIQVPPVLRFDRLYFH